MVEARRRTKVQPGGHRLRQEVLAHHKRERIIRGAAVAIAKDGYRAISVTDLVRSAAVARKAFYEHFASKEDCFLALYEWASEDALSAVEDACRGTEGDFPARVEAGLAALLGYLDRNPEIARACIVEGPAAGPAMAPGFERVISAFAALLRAGRRQDRGPELPETVEETVVGGLYWLIYWALMDNRRKKTTLLLPQLVGFSLIPFSGAGAFGPTPA